jgi:hypothetical protein
MAKKQDTDTNTTASLSHFSGSLTEQAIKDAITLETDKLQVQANLRETAMETRIKSLETTLANLTAGIVADIFKHMSGANSPFVTKVILDAKLDQQFALIKKLSQQIDQIATAVAVPKSATIDSPPCKLPRNKRLKEQIDASLDHPMGDNLPPHE